MKTKVKNQRKSNITERKVPWNVYIIIMKVRTPNDKSRGKIEKKLQQTQFLSRSLCRAASTSWLFSERLKICLGVACPGFAWRLIPIGAAWLGPLIVP